MTRINDRHIERSMATTKPQKVPIIPPGKTPIQPTRCQPCGIPANKPLGVPITTQVEIKMQQLGNHQDFGGGGSMFSLL